MALGTYIRQGNLYFRLSYQRYEFILYSCETLSVKPSALIEIKSLDRFAIDQQYDNLFQMVSSIKQHTEGKICSKSDKTKNSS
jgi:hypothetical protein